MARNPAYATVYDVLKKEIIEGDFAIGDLLPTEPELEKRFGVSRTTVRKAVDLLSREGFVQARQGKGTVVLDNRTKQNLNVVTSISETLRKKGYEVAPKSIYIDRIPASPHIAGDLGIEAGALVVRVQRIELADGKPIAIMKNYLKTEMVPGIEGHIGEISSLYHFLEERYGINIDSAHDRITARTADFTEAEMLNVTPGTALLYMKRVCCSNGIPVCVDRLSLLGDRYELEVDMTGRFKESSM